MRTAFKLLVVLTLVFTISQTSVTPAFAETYSKCQTYLLSDSREGQHKVDICLQYEYLPGGVRAFMTFHCYITFNNGQKSDRLCNYEVRNLKLYKNDRIVATMPYAHAQGLSRYKTPPTPWYHCTVGRTATYNITFEQVNVRDPIGKLWSIPPFSYSRSISCG